MAIVGMGTDIVEIARIEQAVARTAAFARRILSPPELIVYETHAQPVRYLAKRFAAKEAAVKALGSGIGRGVSWQHISVLNTTQGAPVLTFYDGALALCEERGVTGSHVSLSDEEHYAVATVILEQ